MQKVGIELRVSRPKSECSLSIDTGVKGDFNKSKRMLISTFVFKKDCLIFFNKFILQ